MKHPSITIRKASRIDHRSLLLLYENVAAEGSGIARQKEEISEKYIISIIDTASLSGLILVAFDEKLKIVVGCIHASKNGLAIFDHVLTDLTILIHPSHQDVGLGKALFNEFLSLVEKDYASILRVELFCRASNQKALRLYQKLGFVQEGWFERRVKGVNNSMEADIAMAWFNPSYYRHQEPSLDRSAAYLGSRAKAV